jgi:phosphohistidine phosphatase SixA
MKRLFWIVASALCIAATAYPQPTLYIVRHAEKLANWPEKELGDFQPLSETGVATSHRLAKHLASIKFAAIYSSSTTRALHTAFPFAQELGLPIDTALALRDTSAIATFYAELSKKFNANQFILLVTHSNIIPYLLMNAGLSRDCFDRMGIQRSMSSSWLVIEGYDNLYRVERLGAKREKCDGITRGKF